MISIMEAFSIIFYILLIILVILLIVLVIEALKTLNKANIILDDIKAKSDKMNGLFDIMVSTSSIVSGITDKITILATNFITKLFNRKGDGENE